MTRKNEQMDGLTETNWVITNLSVCHHDIYYTLLNEVHLGTDCTLFYNNITCKD